MRHEPSSCAPRIQHGPRVGGIPDPEHLVPSPLASAIDRSLARGILEAEDGFRRQPNREDGPVIDRETEAVGYATADSDWTRFARIQRRKG
jgi:hypothetical protein